MKITGCTILGESVNMGSHLSVTALERPSDQKVFILHPALGNTQFVLGREQGHLRISKELQTLCRVE